MLTNPSARCIDFFHYLAFAFVEALVHAVEVLKLPNWRPGSENKTALRFHVLNF